MRGFDMSRHQTYTWLVTSVAAAAVAFAWLYGSKKAVPTVGKDTSAREEVRALESKVARLERASQWQAEMLTQHAERLKGEAGGVSDKRPPAASGEAAGAPRQHIPDETEYEAQLEVKFQAETRDPQWSREASTEARRALSTDLPIGSALETVDCRANLCRVESSHASVEAFRTFVEAALMSRGKKLWNAGFSAQVVAQSASGIKAVTFIAREGQAVPVADTIPD
jgi:hypothetical protein